MLIIKANKFKYWEGDLEAFRFHGAALLKMAATRSGTSSSSISGFLLYLLRTSVYNPSFHLVAGPIR